MNTGAGPAGLLAVRVDDLRAIEAAIQRAHDGLLEQASGALGDARVALSEWSDATASRQAQLDVEQHLQRHVEELVESLSALSAEVARAVERLTDAESRALAALD